MSADFLGSSFVPPNPKEIAIPHAEAMSKSGFEHTEADRFMLAELEQVADELNFLGGRYFVECKRSFIFPADTGDESSIVHYYSYFDTILEGELISYSRLSIGQLVGRQAVRALCLTFDKSILLPTFIAVIDKI
jgi:hypothetical protein